MDYEGRICRAPMERSAYKLPIMVGCIYNKCKFCDLFKDLKFRIIPINEVEADLKKVYDAGGNPRKIFLGDGSAFALDTDYLLQILELIHHYFPECCEINMNSTVTGILKKSDDELRLLSENGVKHLYIGLESGLEDVLKFMNKGNTVSQLKEAVSRILKYGMFFDAHIMTGSAGHSRGYANAEATAAVLTELHASSVTNFSMFIHEVTPLYDDLRNGSFNPASEYENLVEEKHLIETICKDMDIASGEHIKYEGFHDYIAFHIWGTLPQDKEKIIESLNKKIDEYDSKKSIVAVIDHEHKFEMKSVY